MASGAIKGITIEFRGDTTKLGKALGQISDKTKGLENQLKGVDKALRFNPRNVELLGQKQELLKQKIGKTKKELEAFKAAQAAMDSKGVDKTSNKYMKVRRNVIEAESKLKSFNAELKATEKASSPLNILGKEFEDIGGKITAASRALAPLSKVGAVVAGGMGALAIKTGKAADDLNTLSKVSGIGTQELQMYAAAADLVDVSVEDMAKSQTKLKKSMYSAQQGSKGALDAFNALGVSVTDAGGNLRNQNDVFQEIIEKLGGMENETERDAIAMQIFGKTATNLNPLIKDMGQTYKQVTDTMKTNKIEFADQKTLDQANKFNDQLDTMKLTAQAAFTQIGAKIAAELLPHVEKLAEGFSKLMGWIANLDGRTLAIIGTIASVIAVLAPTLLIIGKVITIIGTMMGTLSTLGGAIGTVVGILGGPLTIAIGAIIGICVLLWKNWDTVKEKLGKLGEYFKLVWGSMKEMVSSAWSGIKTVTLSVVNTISSTVSSVFNALKNTVSAAWSGLKYGITHPIEAAYSIVSNIISRIKGLFNFRFQWPHIPLPHFSMSGSLNPFSGNFPPKIGLSWYAQGGIFDKPTIAGIGEKGSEAVLPTHKLDKFLQDAVNKIQPNQGNGIQINIESMTVRDNSDIKRLAEEIERRITLKANRNKLAGGLV